MGCDGCGSRLPPTSSLQRLRKRHSCLGAVRKYDWQTVESRPRDHLAGGILIAMGAWVVVREALSFTNAATRRRLRRQPRRRARLPEQSSHDPRQSSFADTDRSGQIDFREAMLLGIALTPNNLVNGAAAA